MDIPEFDNLFTSFKREALHLEMRDAYGTAAEIPPFGQVGGR